MSEHTLVVISTICGVIGTLADLTIVALMVNGESKTVGDQRRRPYWPWLLAMAMVTAATAAPAYLTYRLATGSLTAIGQSTPGHVIGYLNDIDTGEVVSSLPKSEPQKQATTAPAAARPLSDDALKWLVAKDLRLDSTVIKGACHVVIIHYQVPYSENYADDLTEVLSAIPWVTWGRYADDKLPQGISLKASAGLAHECAMRFKSRMEMDLKLPSINIEDLPANTVTAYTMTCPTCFEIHIGNEPGS